MPYTLYMAWKLNTHQIFLLNVFNTTFLMLYISAHKKTTAMVFIWGDTKYSPIHFEYKTASGVYFFAKIFRKQFHRFLYLKISIFSEFTQECFAYISVTKYSSEAILYSKWTGEYPLSPHLTLINAAYFYYYLTRGAQSSPPLKSTFLMDFENFVYTGA